MPAARRISGRSKRAISVSCMFWISCLGVTAAVPRQAQTSAFMYLQKESSRWSSENGCFSCHNNGDAVRALLSTQPKNASHQKDATRELLSWLNQPDEWLKTTSEGVGESPILTYIQFGTARAEAVKAGIMFPSPKVETKIFQKLVSTQSEAGFWHLEPEGNVGSPGTYGNALASYQAISLLKSAPSKIYGSTIQRCYHWAAGFEPKATVDVAAIALILSDADSAPWKQRSKTWRLHLLKSQNQDGGWGPFPNRFSEVFDTAIASIALSQRSHTDEIRDHLKRARTFLIGTQEGDGGWPETTRPTGGVSYAQHISTTSWALIALSLLSEPAQPIIATPEGHKKTQD